MRSHNIQGDMVIRRVIFSILLLSPINFIIGQQINDIKFNHLSLTLEHKTLEALSKSLYVKDTLGVFETKTTYFDSSSTITTCFLYGQSNYLELFETNKDDPNLGFLTIVFSVDKINGLQVLKKELDKSYQTGISTHERNFNGQKVPWYESMAVLDTTIIDSVYLTRAHFWYWIMGYKKEYFDYNGYRIENDELTRENYLERYFAKRNDRIIQNFTGIGIKLNDDEKKYLTRFFDYIGFVKLDENKYLSIDNFQFQINDRQPGDQNALEFIEFETSEVFIRKRDIKISDHISVSIQGHTGHIFIN